MITVDDAKNRLESKYADLEADSAYEYGDKYYLFLAPTEGSMNEPYYIVDKYSGKSRYLNPLEDFDTFCDAMENRLIKKFKTGGDKNDE